MPWKDIEAYKPITFVPSTTWVSSFSRHSYQASHFSSDRRVPCQSPPAFCPEALGLRNLLQAILIRAVPATSTLLKPRLLLGNGDFELAASKEASVALLAELLGTLEVAEADRGDAVDFLVEQGDVGDVAKPLSFLAQLRLDVGICLDVVVQLLESEEALEYADFGPLVLLRRKDLGDFLLVVGPLGELAME